MRLLINDSIEVSLAGGCAAENMVNAGDALQFPRSNLQTSIAEASAIITSEPHRVDEVLIGLPFVAAKFGALIEIFQKLIAHAVNEPEKPRGVAGNVVPDRDPPSPPAAPQANPVVSGFQITY